MKILFFLLFLISCHCPKTLPDVRWDYPEQNKIIRIAKLDNGAYVEYDECSDSRECCPKKEYLGKGKIYAIKGVIQSDPATYHFFKPIK